MLFDSLKRINWVDIIAVILLIRVSYISLKTGLITEIFKLLGTVCAIFLACHYYVRASIFLNLYLPFKGEAGVNFLNFFTFSVLFLLGYFFFVIIRLVLTIFIKMEVIPQLNRWGGLILGVVRWSLSVSLLLFAINISNISYFRNSLSNSFSGLSFFKLTPKTYICLWDNLMFRFMRMSALNKAVLDVSLNTSE